MSAGSLHSASTLAPDFAVEAERQPELRRLTPEERAPWLRWLDDGLREGRHGRLAAEYGTLLDEPATAHVLLRVEGARASHALVRTVDVRLRGQALRVGMIGLVYTDPAHRRRGLAGRCLEAACAWLAEEGASHAALWSDRRGFYDRSGFAPAGRERFLYFDATIVAEAARSFAAPGAVRPPDDADWRTLETLYAAKPVHTRRAEGLLASLAAAPDCRVRVAGPVGRPCAYAARGRGDDFPGIVHEWAGEGAGVLGCLRELVPVGGALGMIAGSAAETPVETLLAAGADLHEGCVALVRPLAETPLPPEFFLWGFDSV